MIGIFKMVSLIENYNKKNSQRIFDLLELSTQKQELLQIKKSIDEMKDGSYPDQLEIGIELVDWQAEQLIGK